LEGIASVGVSEGCAASAGAACGSVTAFGGGGASSTGVSAYAVIAYRKKIPANNLLTTDILATLKNKTTPPGNSSTSVQPGGVLKMFLFQKKTPLWYGEGDIVAEIGSPGRTLRKTLSRLFLASCIGGSLASLTIHSWAIIVPLWGMRQIGVIWEIPVYEW
jgi:hypothetical protein